MNLLISTCLLGLGCRYDGQTKNEIDLGELPEKYHLIPVCPECYGGLPTPRRPAERRGERVIADDGTDVTQAFQKGAEETLKLARRFHCTAALLKERSPSCGSGAIYDGTFSHTLISGYGMTAELLRKNGIRVYGESQLDLLLREEEQ